MPRIAKNSTEKDLRGKAAADLVSAAPAPTAPTAPTAQVASPAPPVPVNIAKAATADSPTKPVRGARTAAAVPSAGKRAKTVETVMQAKPVKAAKQAKADKAAKPEKAVKVVKIDAAADKTYSTPAAKVPRKAAAAKTTSPEVRAPIGSPASDAVVKAKKAKLVRDSFTMPETEYAVLGTVKKRCIKAGFDVKKSELLRIGVALIADLSIAELKKLLAALAPLKVGRPRTEK